MVWFALYSNDTFEPECVVRYAGAVSDLSRLCVNIWCNCKKSAARWILYKYPNMPLYQQDALFRYSSEPCDEPISMLKRRKRGKYYRYLLTNYLKYKRLGKSVYRYDQFFGVLFSDLTYNFDTKLHQSDIVAADVKMIKYYVDTGHWKCNILGYNRRVICMVTKCLRGNIKATNDTLRDVLA